VGRAVRYRELDATSSGEATLSHTNNSIYTIAKGRLREVPRHSQRQLRHLWRIVQFGHRVRHGYGNWITAGQRVDSGAGESLNNERGLPKYLS